MLTFDQLATRFTARIAEEPGQWRVGKGLAKLQRIDQSIAEDSNKFEKVQMMVKREVYIQPLDGTAKGPKKARGIQYPLNERSAYEYAEQAHAFAGALSDVTAVPALIAGTQFLVRYSAKMSHAEIGLFATESESLRRLYQYSCIDERDGKNWDANVQEFHREAVVRIYDRLDPGFGAYARRGICVRGHVARTEGCRLSYRVIGTVKSGHFDTSSGNSALNRDIAIQAILLLPQHLKPTLVRGLVMGDDYIAWLYFDRAVDPGELKGALNASESRLGIHPERGIFDRIEHASYVSLTFYRCVDGQIAALPKIGRLLAKLFWTVTPLNGRDPARLASGIAAAFYPLYSTFPPVRAFLRAHMHVAPIDARGYEAFYQWFDVGLQRLPAPIDWRANHLVKYGPLSLFLEVQLPVGAGVVHDVVVDEILTTDLSDPADRLGCLA